MVLNGALSVGSTISFQEELIASKNKVQVRIQERTKDLKVLVNALKDFKVRK